MGYYVIGIGGTGAKCIEALVHLTASGMMPDGELYALFVDPDKANGSLERAQMTLTQYRECKQQLQLGSIDLMKTPLIVAKPDVWSPFGDEAKPRLDNFFQYNILKTSNLPAAALFDVLYSPLEKTTTLEKGFRGHPSIGAAVMAKTIRLGQGEPWARFRELVNVDVRARAGAKIFLFGSIFGGTGASGFPTIAHLIKNELKAIGPQNAKLGGALMLPYFSFVPEEDDTELRASSKNFLLSTQAALAYYRQLIDMGSIYDSVTLLGDESLSQVKKYSVGAKEQKNEPHFIELYAALAAIDFFSAESPTGYPVLVARAQSEHLDWSDLPDGDRGNAARQKIGQLARFAFAYLSTYWPMIQDIRHHGREYRAPWYVDFFKRQHLFAPERATQTQTALEAVKTYSETFLSWLADIQTSASEQRINLANHHAFAEEVQRDGRAKMELRPQFRIDDFRSLILPDDSYPLSQVWTRMCDFRRREAKQADGVGQFIHALYRSCA